MFLKRIEESLVGDKELNQFSEGKNNKFLKNLLDLDDHLEEREYNPDLFVLYCLL